MVSVCKLGETINQTGVKGGKSKRSKIPPQSLSFSFSPRPRFSRFAAHHSPLVRSRDVRSIALKTLGKERDCSQSTSKTNEKEMQKKKCFTLHPTTVKTMFSACFVSKFCRSNHFYSAFTETGATQTMNNQKAELKQ